jgi:hypothetical protein
LVAETLRCGEEKPQLQAVMSVRTTQGNRLNF